MAQQIINTGEEPNDGTGEPLRSAFNAVNENFTEIYAAGPVGSNVVISGNTVAVTGINNNLVLSGNGIGEVQLNSSMTPTVNAVFNIGTPTAQFSTIYADYFVGNGALLTGIAGGSGAGDRISNGDSNVVIATQDGNVQVSVDGTANVVVFQKRNVAFTANLIPAVGSNVDIGSSTLPFRDLYLSGQTIYLGNAEFSANSTAITITNPAGGTFVLQGSGQFAPYGNANVADFLPTYTGNLRSLQGNVLTTANVRASSIIANNVVSTRDVSVTGNIVGSGSAVIRDIGINVANITVTNVLQGTGAVQVSGNVSGGNINTTGDVNAVNVTASGNIVTGSGTGGNISGANVISANTVSAGLIAAGQLSVAGNVVAEFFIGNGSQLTGLPESYSNANVESYLLTNTGNISAGAFISDNFVSGTTLTLTADGANLSLSNDGGVPVLQPAAESNLYIRTQNASTFQFEFTTDGVFKSPVDIQSPRVTTSVLSTNIIRSDDSSAVLIDEGLNVRGLVDLDTGLQSQGNIAAPFFIGNGSLLTGVVATGISEVPSLSVTGNVNSGNIVNQGLITTGGLSATGNIVGSANSQLDGFVIGSVTPAAAAFTDVNVTGNLSVAGVTNTANIFANGTVSVSGQVDAASIGVLGNIQSGNVNTIKVSATDVSTVSLSATGNVDVVGNVSADYFIGNGRALTGIISSYQDSNVAAFLPTYTGNIASLTGNLTTTANVNANNISASNLIIASRITTTGDALIGGNLVVNGNTVQINVEELNVEDPVIGVGRGANNTPLTLDDGKSRGLQLWYYDSKEEQAFVGWDTANSVLIAAANVSVNNDVVSVNEYGTFVTGNVSASDVTASGNIVTGSGSGGNITGANVISANTVNAATVSATTVSTTGNVSAGGSLTAVGNITANTYFGSADGLTFIPAGNIVGTVALAEAANIANTVTNSNQANITAVGTLTSLSVSGNVAVDTNTLIVREDLNAVGIGGTPVNKLTVIDNTTAVASVQNIASFYSTGLIDGDTSVLAVGVDENNRATLGYLYAGNADPDNSIVLGVQGQTVLDINADRVANFAGNVVVGSVEIDKEAAAISGLAEINTAVISVTANVTSGNLVATGNVSVGGNVVGNNIAGTNLIQSNTASVTGNLVAGNVNSTGIISTTGSVQANSVNVTSLISTTGNIVATGNVTAANFIGNLVGSFTAPGSNTQVLFNNDGVLAATQGLVFDSVGNILTVGGNIATNNGGNLNVSGAISVVGNVTVSIGNINGGNINGSTVSATGTITGANINTSGNLSVTSTITSGNINSSGTVSATGAIVAVGNVSGGNLVSLGAVSATGTATTGNVSTAGFVSAAGNVTGGNVSTAGRITATGNIVGGNVNTVGRISATGNITTSEFFVGNFLGNITGNISVTGSNTQVLFNNDGNVGAAAGLTYDSDANVLAIMGNVSATGNIVGGNLITNGAAEITGNVSAGNVLATALSLSGNVISAINTVNDITTTGNITANNISVSSTININGNQVATVDDATALAIALG
jgi:hypothetical protein